MECTGIGTEIIPLLSWHLNHIESTVQLRASFSAVNLPASMQTLQKIFGRCLSTVITNIWPERKTSIAKFRPKPRGILDLFLEKSCRGKLKSKKTILDLKLYIPINCISKSSTPPRNPCVEHMEIANTKKSLHRC